MKTRILGVFVMVVLAVAMSPAQTKSSITGKCQKPDTRHSVPADDQSGHAFMLAQGKCSAAGDVGGAAAKEAVFSQHAEVTGDHIKNWGVYVETFESGDKVYYSYQGMGTFKNGGYQSGTNKYQITSGTGKMKGIKGSGSCKLTGNDDGTLDYSCTGEYTMNGGSMKKQ